MSVFLLHFYLDPDPKQTIPDPDPQHWFLQLKLQATGSGINNNIKVNSSSYLSDLLEETLPPLLPDMEDAVLCRHLRQGADPLRHRVHHPLSGPLHQLHLRLQHRHEGQSVII